MPGRVDCFVGLVKKYFKKKWIGLTAGSLKLAQISIAVELRLLGKKTRSSLGCWNTEGSQAVARWCFPTFQFGLDSKPLCEDE